MGTDTVWMGMGGVSRLGMGAVTWLLLLLVVAPTPTSATLSADKLQDIDDFILRFLNCSGIPGAALVVVQDDEVLISKGYGVARLQNPIPVTASTNFCIGSLTKAFTATLLAVLLHKDERYTWDTTVRDLLGDDFHFSNGYYSNHTTLRDVMGMRTGFPSNTDLIILDQFSLDELVRRLRFFEPVIPFRTGFVYQNLMYGVAGHFVEKLGGAPWFDLIKSHLLDPIGMTTTTLINRAPPDYEGFATPYFTREGQSPEVAPRKNFGGFRCCEAAGWLASTAEDMARWMLFWLNDTSTSDGTTLLPPAELKDLLQPEVSRSRSRNIKEILLVPYEKYSKGWNMGFYRDLQMMSHGGSLNGYTSRLQLLPDRKYGSFIVFNHDNYQMSTRMLLFINDIILYEERLMTADDICALIPDTKRRRKRNEFPDVSLIRELIGDQESCKQSEISKMKTFCKFLESQGFYDSARTEDVSLQMEDYVGEYGHFGYGNVSVTVSEQTLLMHYGSFAVFRLDHVTDDIFQSVSNASYLYDLGTVYFQRSPLDGTVDRLSVPFLEESVLPTFERGLLLSDAPAPDLNSCYSQSTHTPQQSSTPSSFYTPVSMLLLTLVVIVFIN